MFSLAASQQLYGVLDLKFAVEVLGIYPREMCRSFEHSSIFSRVPGTQEGCRLVRVRPTSTRKAATVAHIVECQIDLQARFGSRRSAVVNESANPLQLDVAFLQSVLQSSFSKLL